MVLAVNRLQVLLCDTVIQKNFFLCEKLFVCVCVLIKKKPVMKQFQ